MPLPRILPTGAEYVINKAFQEHLASKRDPFHNMILPESEKLRPNQIADFLRVGKITQEEATQLLADYNRHVL